MSAASTTDPDWWAGLGSLLRSHAGVAERLTVEITESAAIHDIDETRGFVARVKDLGCRIAIDDFGAGYTSFRNLRKLGVDIVKIDGAFVHDMMRSEDDRAFVRTLIDLAKRLKLEHRRRMGAGRGGGADLAGLGLRLSAGRADRPRHDRAAVAHSVGKGRLGRRLTTSDLVTDLFVEDLTGKSGPAEDRTAPTLARDNSRRHRRSRHHRRSRKRPRRRSHNRA